MSDWAVVVAGLGGAAVAATATLAAGQMQTRGGRLGREEERRFLAYARVLTHSVGVAQRVATLLTVLRTRSSLAEGLSVTLGIREPADAQVLHDWLGADWSPLLDAWSEVWLVGTPQGVSAANRVVDVCADLMHVLQIPPAKNAVERLRRTVVGISTDDALSRWNEGLKVLGDARKDLAHLVREETGRPVATLFSSDVSAETPPTTTEERRP